MENEINSYFKYFQVSSNDLKWNLHIENLGVSKVNEGSAYPQSDHPSTHDFTWERGRRLSSYQLIFITSGRGVFESKKSGKVNVIPGSIFLLYPYEWHRYRPLKKTGWKEFWIGFNGSVAETLVENSFFKKKSPVISLKHVSEIQKLYTKAIELSMNEKPGFQQIVAGITYQIFGQIQYIIRNKNFEGKAIEQTISKAREIMEQNAHKNIDVPTIASDLNMSYALFRKKFKEFTGMSPKQYFIQLKINQAKDMLLSSAGSIKSIAYKTGFESAFYFSKAFKEKTGYSPSEFRNIASI